MPANRPPRGRARSDRSRQPAAKPTTSPRKRSAPTRAGVRPGTARSAAGEKGGKPGRSRRPVRTPRGGKRESAAKTRTAAKPRSAAPSAAPGAALSPTLARRLLHLESAMQKRIIGKDEAVARIACVVRVRMTELDFRPGRPKGSFLLVGPTGVGKNELALALSEALYGTEKKLVSIDLAELAEEGDIAKLGVTPVPGIPNQVMEGLLTSPVRALPGAIILLRGLERAHASFYPILQQILERGRLEDMLGEVDFGGTIIFVTTRPRREDATAEIGFSRTPVPPAEALQKRLERNLPAELLDAFNEIIELPPLSTADVRRIARYKVEAVLGRLRRTHRRVAVADTVYETFLPEAEIRKNGVTVLHRTLEDRLFNPLARYLLAHRGHRQIEVDVVGGELAIREAARPDARRMP